MAEMGHDATFRALHAEGSLLILPNAWDAGSARVIASCGARAIATSSAAVAWAHGVADGERLSRELLFADVAEIARAMRVPVTADIETGFSRDADGVADTIARVLEAGAVGVNLEDGKSPPEELAARIAAARRAAAKAGVELFVNARCDVYLARLAPPERAVEETLRRAAIYRDAGADGLFVPYLKSPEEIRAVVAAAKLPVNVLVTPGLPAIPELRALGVRRVSAGSHVAAAAMGAIRRAATAMLGDGTYGALLDGQIPYAELQTLFST